MPVLLSASLLRHVHDVNVKSKNGRAFVIDIYQQNANTFDSTVTVLDRISSNPGSWLYAVNPPTTSENDNFSSAIELIQNYLASVDKTDAISDIHNPCNCPFVKEGDQNQLLSKLDIALKVRVN